MLLFFSLSIPGIVLMRLIQALECVNQITEFSIIFLKKFVLLIFFPSIY